MTKDTIDRRARRTRAALQQALLSLLHKEPYDAISVHDICEAADVGRSTFYEHYTSKDELKRSGLDHLRKVLIERQQAALAAPDRAQHERFAFGVTLFEHAREHLGTYRALVRGRGQVVALGRIRQILAELIRAELQSIPGVVRTQQVEKEVIVRYLIGAYMAVLTWWLDTGARQSPAEMDQVLRRLSVKGIAGFIA